MSTAGTSHRVTVVGSGTRFLSGISYYTHRVATALAERHGVSVVLMRQLLPTRLYPGRERVGSPLARFQYPSGVPVFDGIDWFWGPRMLRALAFVRRARPEVVLLQWWTGTVIHSYIALALLARARGARVVIEFHEVLDTGELNIRAARVYVRALAPLLLRLTDGFVVHSEFDRSLLRERYGLGDRPIALAPHGPYDSFAPPGEPALSAPRPVTAEDPCRLLYFGVIRPFKGVEDIVAAFDGLGEADADRFRLTIAGETWEGWDAPAEAIDASPRRHHIDFVNRYVSDDEVEGLFVDADVVVLPYHRSSASGPLHVAMSHGLPVVVSRVGGLIEAAGEYEGAVFTEPRNPDRLRADIVRAAEMRGTRFADPHSWGTTVDRLSDLFDAVLGRRKRGAA